jgi:hypothetical protein
MEKLLLMDTAKSEFLNFSPKRIFDFFKGDTENRIVGGSKRHTTDARITAVSSRQRPN